MSFVYRIGCVVSLATLLALAAKPQIILVRDCLLSVELSDKAECHGDDFNHMSCTGILITKRKGCESIKAK